MQLRSLDVLGGQGAQLHLALDDTITGFSVKSIEGLDPVPATVSSGSFANLDGEQYYNARRQKRNIKITLGLEPDFATQDVQTLRDQLYRYFMPKSQVKLTFNMFDRFAVTTYDQLTGLVISGRVESFDSVLFALDPQVVISILCFDPDFVDPRPITVDASTATDVVIDYKGTVSTGLLLHINQPVTGENDGYSFTHTTPDGNLHNLNVDFTMFFYQPQYLEINSVPGSKSAIFNNYEVEFSILYLLSADSAWLTLQPGTNLFHAVTNPDPGQYYIQYTNRFGGL